MAAPGPTHANLLAEEAGLDSVMVPIAPGTFCALGAILADVRRDYVRTARQLVGAAGNRDAARDAFAVVGRLSPSSRREALRLGGDARAT